MQPGREQSPLNWTPLDCTYRGYRIVSAPPPSSGGITLCEILNIASGWDLGAAGFHSPRAVHLAVEAMRWAFLDRNTALGDPDFMVNPVGRLLSAEHAARLRATINPERATPSAALGMVAADEKPQTTHFSVADGDGNSVAVTFTINGGFGAAVVAPGTGFLLNNEMDDFAVRPGAANMFGLVQARPTRSRRPSVPCRR